jgi:hypothetical protein
MYICMREFEIAVYIHARAAGCQIARTCKTIYANIYMFICACTNKRRDRHDYLDQTHKRKEQEKKRYFKEIHRLEFWKRPNAKKKHGTFPFKKITTKIKEGKNR